MAEYEPCFVYKLGEAEDYTSSGRPEKRRKLLDRGIYAPFAPHFAAKEGIQCSRLRHECFRAAWDHMETSLEGVSTEHYANTINEIVSFVGEAEAEAGFKKLPTGLIVGAPNLSSQAGLTDAIARELRKDQEAVVVGLASTQLPNLKAALKYINRQATSRASSENDGGSVERGRYLNYDLQMLRDHVENHSIQKVILYFQDSEGFPEALLSDLLELFSSWNDRIPFVLLFGIATSTDLFKEKLSQASLRLLRSVNFEVNQLDVDVLFKAVTRTDSASRLWLGPGLSKLVIQRHRDYVQTTADFIRAIKYLYMSHFFSDPLSILVKILESPGTAEANLQHEHFEAIRTLPSFKGYAEELLNDGEIDSVRSLLEDDQALFETIAVRFKETQKALGNLIAGIERLETIQAHQSLKKSVTWSELYILAMSSDLNDSVLMREILLAVKKMPSDRMHEMIGQLSDAIVPIKSIHKDLGELISARPDQGAPLRSEHDIHHNTLRTTVVAQKVELSKQTAALSKEDKAYSKIVDRVATVLQEYFQQVFINPQDLFLGEVLVYDANSPYRDVFTPKPRFAVERALSSPHDYLGCTCCDSAESGLSPTQPATAILYQLYLESGSQINISDLWSAFNTLVGVEEPEADEGDQQRTLALFSQALAELKYLGMIKNSRKKVDHLTKLAWKGL